MFTRLSEFQRTEGPELPGKSGEHIPAPHLAAMRLVFAHEEWLELSHELFVQLAFLVGLHVGQVFPQAHGEAGILVSRILDEQATVEPLDRLTLDVRSIGALELVPRSAAQPAPRNPHHHSPPPSRNCARYRPRFTSILGR